MSPNLVNFTYAREVGCDMMEHPLHSLDVGFVYGKHYSRTKTRLRSIHPLARPLARGRGIRYLKVKGISSTNVYPLRPGSMSPTQTVRQTSPLQEGTPVG